LREEGNRRVHLIADGELL